MSNPHQPPPAAPLQHLLLRPGQPVHVNHRASWLDATVTSVGYRTVGVRYPNTTTAFPLAEAVLPWAVRPADGARLRAARQITAGDQIIFGTRIRTVATPPVEGHDGWLTVTFTDDTQTALVMAGAVLRLVDDTPQVTVNGRPLAPLSPPGAGTAVTEPTTGGQLPLTGTATPAQARLAPDTTLWGRRDQRVVPPGASAATTTRERGV